jgi:glycerophosphoryl diester phosphodiesterase
MKYFLVFCVIVFSNFSCSLLNTKPVKQIINNFENENGSVMIVAHRANIVDTLPENSIESVLMCIKNQIDIVEIDIQKTKDNVLVVLHDETLDRMTNGTGKVSNITLEELKKLKLRQTSYGKVTIYTVPTLEEVFLACRGKIMINVDKAFWWLDEVNNLAEQYNMSRQIIVKSYENKQKIDTQLGECPAVFFMPIISESNYNNLEILPSYLSKKNLCLPDAYELIFDQKDDELANLEFMEELSKYGGRVWVNTLSDGLCGGFSDNKNPEANWDTLIKKGVNIIQTDKALLLKNFLNK